MANIKSADINSSIDVGTEKYIIYERGEVGKLTTLVTDVTCLARYRKGELQTNRSVVAFIVWYFLNAVYLFLWLSRRQHCFQSIAYLYGLHAYYQQRDNPTTNIIISCLWAPLTQWRTPTLCRMVWQRWDGAHLFNPFTAPVCTIFGLKDARTCLKTVYFPVLWHIYFQCYAFFVCLFFLHTFIGCFQASSWKWTG